MTWTRFSARRGPRTGLREGMAEEQMSYHVVVTRDGDGWMADVPAIPGTHTWAKTLRALDRNIREVIGMVEDLPRSAEASLDLGIEYRTGDPTLTPAPASCAPGAGKSSATPPRSPTRPASSPGSSPGSCRSATPPFSSACPRAGSPSSRYPTHGTPARRQPQQAPAAKPKPGPRFRDCARGPDRAGKGQPANGLPSEFNGGPDGPVEQSAACWGGFCRPSTRGRLAATSRSARAMRL
jgi:predicted RNase H-like HicB family nuclease